MISSSRLRISIYYARLVAILFLTCSFPISFQEFLRFYLWIIRPLFDRPAVHRLDGSGEREQIPIRWCMFWVVRGINWTCRPNSFRATKLVRGRALSCQNTSPLSGRCFWVARVLRLCFRSTWNRFGRLQRLVTDNSRPTPQKAGHNFLCLRSRLLSRFYGESPASDRDRFDIFRVLLILLVCLSAPKVAKFGPVLMSLRSS